MTIHLNHFNVLAALENYTFSAAGFKITFQGGEASTCCLAKSQAARFKYWQQKSKFEK